MSKDQSVDALVALLTSLVGAVETREMMGATGLYLHGAQFGIVSDGRVYYRTDHLNRADYAGLAEADAFCPSAGLPGDLAWRPLPPAVLDDADALAAWTRKAWEAAKRARKSSAR